MILRQLSTPPDLTPHSCGRMPTLVEARGRAITDPRLWGKPALQYHVECNSCGVTTGPHYTRRGAFLAWQLHDKPGHPLQPIHHMPALRISAERALADAA